VKKNFDTAETLTYAVGYVPEGPAQVELYASMRVVSVDGILVESQIITFFFDNMIYI